MDCILYIELNIPILLRWFIQYNCVTLMHVTETDFTPAYFGGKTLVWPAGLLREAENYDYKH